MSYLKVTFKRFDINQIHIYMERDEAGEGCASVALFFQLLCVNFFKIKSREEKNEKVEKAKLSLAIMFSN